MATSGHGTCLVRRNRRRNLSVHVISHMLAALLIGLILGFVGSIPIAGPTAAVVTSRALDGRSRAALSVAVGAATAESMYAAMAFCGLTTIVHRFPIVLPLSRTAACVALAALGLYFLVRPPKPRTELGRKDAGEGLRGVVFGFTMSGANPTLLVSWTTTVGIAHSAGLLSVEAKNAFPFAGGAGMGIVAWASVLLWLIGRFRNRVSDAMIARTFRATGIALLVCSLGLGIGVLANL